MKRGVTMKEKIKLKNKIIKRDFALLLVVCLAAGALTMLAPSASLTAQAASKSSKKLEKTVTNIISKQTSKKDSKKTRLKKLFKYSENTYEYGRAMGFKAKKGWEKTFASEMYKKKAGSCYHFAAAYAFMAQKATGYKTRIAIGKTNGFNKSRVQPHAWAEIKIGSSWYICDPNMDKFAAKSSGKYFLKKRNKLKKTYNNFKEVKSTTVKW